MVCLGNICRSPLAQGILESKSSKLIVDSAGTAKFHVGKSPDLRSINVAKKYNIDISKQRARQFSNLDFQRFDKIYAMDNDNYSKIISLAKDQEEIDKVELILNEEYPRTYKSVPDPYFGQKDGFQYIYNLLNSVCNKIIEKYEVR
jgi:protein-tyrosine phosphatase